MRAWPGVPEPEADVSELVLEPVDEEGTGWAEATG